jgi:hypothetical protein
VCAAARCSTTSFKVLESLLLEQSATRLVLLCASTALAHQTVLAGTITYQLVCDVCILTIQVPDFGAEVNDDDDVDEGSSSMIVQFTSMEGDSRGPQVRTSFDNPTSFETAIYYSSL